MPFMIANTVPLELHALAFSLGKHYTESGNSRDGKHLVVS